MAVMAGMLAGALRDHLPCGEAELIDLHVRCLNGEGCTLKVSGEALGLEVHQMVSQLLPPKKGGKPILHHLHSRLLLQETLQEQGIVGDAMLSCTYVPTDLHAAWCCLHGLPVSEAEHALEGVTQMEGKTHAMTTYLPRSLQRLTFCNSFNQSLEGVTLPSNLQHLIFGDLFNLSLEGVTLPGNLQNLTFGSKYNQSLEQLTLPSSLQHLEFGRHFNQSLERVTLPSNLRRLRFDGKFGQRLEGVTLPNTLDILTSGIVLLSRV